MAVDHCRSTAERFHNPGITSAAEGICDIGMASRELKDEETKENLTATEIARDGIAVVVSNDNDIDELTSDQVKAIFTGETIVGKTLRNK